MNHRRIRLFIIAALLAVAVSIVGSYAYTEYRKTLFLSDLHLVGFSTSMIGSPSPEQERAAHQRAEELGIDLLVAYENNPETYTRFQLAWMLITNESAEYIQFARQDIDSIPWPEVRIWAVRRHQKSLSSDYRDALLELINASPTSEAKLVSARWFREQGKITESENVLHAAMTNGLFWDALDAAEQLLHSERYRDDAVNHLLSVIRDSDQFPDRAVFSLVNLYGVREELKPLVDNCRKEPKNGPSRELLVDKLTQLTEKESGDSEPKMYAD